jgi:drug/metabolite transporter (DMT)-like permease
MIMDTTLILGQALALVTAVCIAQNSVIYRYLGQRVGSESSAHIRMWLALPLILILTRLIEGIWFPTDWAASSYLALFASGVLGYFVTDLLMFRAFVLLGSRESMVIMTLSPVVTALLSFLLFSERLNALQIIGMTVTIAGVAMMILLDKRGGGPNSTEKQEGKAVGVVLAILAAIFQSISLILAKMALHDGGPASTNLLRNIGGLTAFILYYGIFKRRFTVHVKSFANRRYFFALVLATLAGPVLGMSSQMKALTLAPVGLVTTITQTSPILLLPYERIVLKRASSKASLTGTILSILGIALLFLSA